MNDPINAPGALGHAVAPGPDGMGVDPGLITYTNVIYGLHALSIVIGIVSSATIVGAFVFGVPSIIAVIMNYARRSAVRGTFLESHFSWQIRTFWFALLWAAAVVAVSVVLLIVLIGFATWIIGLILIGLWVAYRVARGWMALRDRRAIEFGRRGA